MTGHPEFIDNQEGNTLAAALGAIFGQEPPAGESVNVSEPAMVRIATAYFNPAGFARIADKLAKVPEVRLLIGAIQDAHLIHQRRQLGEAPESFERRRLREGLRSLDTALQHERDRLPFTLTSASALRKLIAALRSGNLAVRRYEKAFLHAKAYILGSVQGANGREHALVAGSSNLTSAGLTHNLELNLGRYERPIVARAEQWFDALWNDASAFDLAAVFEDAIRPRTPWEIFLRVLWHLYGSEVDEDAQVDDNLPLTNFQKHGVARALRLIRETGGAIVADEVGLGKTFIAGEILQRYISRRQRALIVCPASLRDTTWKGFLNRYQLFAECLSFEQLAGDRRLRDARRPNAAGFHLQRDLPEYQLIVVDEAHNYRNPSAPTRAAALRSLLYGQKRDLLLLTATPVNNSLWDLYHLLGFFLRQDAHLADKGVLSIRNVFLRAMREDPSSLSPDVLYPVIDATTVKRTRAFVRKHYAGDTISGPDGKPRPIEFPQPDAISVRYNLDDQLPGFFDFLERALDPESSDGMGFARYTSDAFLLDADDEGKARARALAGLLRSGLLKRFESSAYAFCQTAAKMVHEHEAFLVALDEGFVVFNAFMQELSADDEAAFEELLAATEHRADAAFYKAEALRTAAACDLEILRELVRRAGAIKAQQDPKLSALARSLSEIAAQARYEAVDAIDEGQKRKVLVFSYFEDTVRWIHDFLTEAVQRQPALASYRGRIAAVSGSGTITEVPRQQVLWGFAPESMGAPAGSDADLYDILISTDVLAEGVNLQQCRHIINFDVPWNPMRLVQRHGRIDRIGSPHSRVFLRTIFPVDRLDQLLNLEERILNKLAMAAASVGVAPPIEGGARGTQVFTETREEIERLLKEDNTLFERGGTAGAAQTGEEYRQTLRKALQQDRDRIVGMPWKAGSGMRFGLRRGVFFCAVVGSESEAARRTFLRFVAADEDWLPATDRSGIERELGACLRIIECQRQEQTWYPSRLQDCVFDFWEVARTDIHREWMHETDPANLQPPVRPLNHKVATFIRNQVPIGFDARRLERALDILESPWPRREEIMLRGWFQDDDHNGTARSQLLVEKILNTGLEPARPPEPLPPIDPEDINLLCWMGIEEPGKCTVSPGESAYGAADMSS